MVRRVFRLSEIEGVMSRAERMMLKPNPAQLHMGMKQRDRAIHDPNMSA